MGLVNLIAAQEKGRKGGKMGCLEGRASFLVTSEHYRRLGRQELNEEACRLQEAGLIRLKWAISDDVLERVTYEREALPALFRLAGESMPYEKTEAWKQRVREWQNSVRQSWIRDWLENLSQMLEKGVVPAELKKEGLWDCFRGLDCLETGIWKRIFSAKYCGDSKFFEKNLQRTVVRIARAYHPGVEEEMTDSQVLSQIGLEEYAQQLSCKGELLLELDGETVDLAPMKYGVNLNSQTLQYARPAKGQKIRKIITIENQANYEAWEWEEGTLLLFSHGFFTPRERQFLEELRERLRGQETAYFHSGDLDYGGIRIFEYTKRIFPELKPLLMDAADHRCLRKQNCGYALTPQKRKKLEALHTDLLAELKAEILSTGIASVFRGTIRSETSDSRACFVTFLPRTSSTRHSSALQERESDCF